METSVNEILKTLEGRVYSMKGLVNYLNKNMVAKKHKNLLMRWIYTDILSMGYYQLSMGVIG